MSDLRYRVTVDGQQGVSSLDKLQQKVGATTSAFQKLQGMIAGLAIGAAIRGVMDMGNRITDLSAATGIATQSIIGFTQAVAANGGSLELGERAITRFGQSLGSALEGTDKNIEAFKNLGISLKDIKTLSQEDLLAKTVDGLSKVENGAARARAATDLFGKSVATVDFIGLNNGLSGFTERAERYAPAVQAAGDANQGLSDSMRILQLEIAVLIQPLSELIIKITENKEAVAEFAAAFVRIVAVLTGATVLKLVAGSFAALATAVGGGTTRLVAFAIGAARLLTPIGLITSALIAVNAVIKSVFNTDILGTFTNAILGGVVEAFQKVKSVLGEIKFIYDQIVGNENIRTLPLFDLRELEDANIALDELNRRLQQQQENLQTAQDQSLADRIFGRGMDAGVISRDIDRISDSIRAVQDRLADEQIELIDQQALADTLMAFDDFIQKANEYTKLDFTDPLTRAILKVNEAETTIRGLEAAFIATNGRVDNFEELMRASSEALREAQKEVRELTEPLRGLQFTDFFANIISQAKDAQRTTEFLTWTLEDLDSQLASGVISQEIYALAVANVNGQLGITTNRLRDQKDILEDLANISQGYTQSLSDGIADAQFEFDSLNMTPLEQQIARINRNLDRDLRNTIESLQNVEGADAGQIAQQIQAVTDATREAQRQQAELARSSYEYQRSFAFGWRNAFQQYKESATDAASTAAKVFQQTTQGLEDAIVGFAKTGKFEWKSFVQDISETLFRASIKQNIASLFEATGLNKLFGAETTAAAMGIAPGETAQRPLFVSVVNGSALSTAQNIQQNIASGFPSQSNPLGDMFSSIGNVFKGAKSLFGGFFATGGMIPPGRFGVVGENGREFVQGPATVTPMSGMGSSVTYNINAVDARSFQQLVAQDPAFLHAVVQRGASKIPGRR